MANDYIYAVARVRSHELTLLNRAFMEQLLQSVSEGEALRLLQERGWGAAGMDGAQTLEAEREKTWALVSELCGEESGLLDLFLYENDYHNLKAAVKETCTAGEHPGIYAKRGTVSGEALERALAARDFEAVPERLRETAREALDVLLQTRDGQRCDCIVDRAALTAIRQAGRDSGSALLARYGELTAAAGDIRIAARGARTGKQLAFLQAALAPCDSFDVQALAQAAAEGEDALADFLRHTPYGEAAEALKASGAAFERYCDDVVIRMIRPQLFNSFGPDPLAAYLLARETEIKSVRMILTGLRVGLSPEQIRGRVRETYVV